MYQYTDFDKQFVKLRAQQFRDQLERWQRGRTGIPLVDAGMRQLLAEGWLPTQVCEVGPREIAGCEEVWIASAGRGVLPVTAVDDRPVGSGEPGPLWQEMHARLQAHLDSIAATPAL